MSLQSYHHHYLLVYTTELFPVHSFSHIQKRPSFHFIIFCSPFLYSCSSFTSDHSSLSVLDWTLWNWYLCRSKTVKYQQVHVVQPNLSFQSIFVIHYMYIIEKYTMFYVYACVSLSWFNERCQPELNTESI